MVSNTGSPREPFFQSGCSFPGTATMTERRFLLPWSVEELEARKQLVAADDLGRQQRAQ